MIATNISAIINTSSINTGIPERDTHLNSSGFLSENLDVEIRF